MVSPSVNNDSFATASPSMTSHGKILLALVAVAVLQVVYYAPQVPPVVASHFNSSGVADGWSSREAFFGIYLAVVSLVVAVCLLIPAIAVKNGQFLRNIPNRSYWLAPERLPQTREFFTRQMQLLGNLHLLLAIGTMQLAITANLGPSDRLSPGIQWMLGCYGILLVLWLVNFYRYFRKP